MPPKLKYPPADTKRSTWIVIYLFPPVHFYLIKLLKYIVLNHLSSSESPADSIYKKGDPLGFFKGFRLTLISDVRALDGPSDPSILPECEAHIGQQIRYLRIRHGRGEVVCLSGCLRVVQDRANQL